MNDFVKTMICSHFSSIDYVARHDYCLREYREYMGNELTDSDISHFNENFRLYGRFEMLSENLKSHNFELLRTRLFQLFDEYVDDVVLYNASNDDLVVARTFGIICENDIVANKLVVDEEFKRILGFFNYYVTYVSENQIFVEPEYPVNVTAKVRTEYNNVLYHFTDDKHYSAILKNGLKIRDSEYRQYPKRIFMCGIKTDWNIFHIKNINLIFDYFQSISGLSVSEMRIIKVDLNKLKNTNIDFYIDKTMETNELFDSIFTYCNIPAFCVSDITNKLMKQWDTRMQI